MYEELILVLDFGGQYCHLISRRVRNLGVFSEILPFDASINKLKDLGLALKGIILSGGPSSVYEENAPKLSEDMKKYIFENKIPLLGLCYGHHLIAQNIGGNVLPEDEKEYGKTNCSIQKNSLIFNGLDKNEIVWMSHGDQVKSLPKGYEILASTDTCPIAAYGNSSEKIYGLQFHPEVDHTPSGNKIISNFIYGICQSTGNWKMDDWIPTTLEDISEQVGDDGVILGLSGGVDSSVTAALLQRAIGKNVHPIFIDNGLLRKKEAEQVIKLFRDELKFENFHFIDAKDLFLNKLKGVTDPEEKRKIIGFTFIEVFDKKAEEISDKFKNIKWLAQGTIFPDRVESAATSKTSAKIKTHHNTALPENMKLKVIEPLKDLYKDEVRKIGLKLGLPEEKVINRQPFPGPGLAVRCLGEITTEKLEILREADWIVQEEIRNAGLSNNLWQYFAAFIPVKNVGVMGDFRTFDYICAVRVVESKNAMTANFAKLDWDVLEIISTRIINEVKGFNRVVYDISNKPPSTIEFE
ncbi:MAG: glutamine-hydrolyzing GMP synthase [archaeon]|nr:glutamine-hydrolyzing GMP synthase [archaeon]